MRFRGLDLNLLAIFAVLMNERSVSLAATRVNLSQPTVSGALARLRDYFQDELLVVQGRQMIPTPLAETLWPQVLDVLRAVGTILDNSSRFVPEESNRSFRIAASDYIVMVLLRPLLTSLEALAPSIKVLIETPGERSVGRLEDGRVDLLITPDDFTSPRHPAELLFEDRFVAVGWRDNPAFAGPISAAAFFALEHVTVLLGTDLPAAFADRQLDQLGLQRRIALTVPHFSAVPWMTVGTMRIGLMHERLARTFADLLPIAISPLPFTFPPIREMVQHHRTRGADPGVQWLRRKLLEQRDAARGSRPAGSEEE